MKVDELKSKILQLAIQGKLVQQDEKDIPASVLLEEIKKEKEKLIKAKKIKKEKPLPEIKEEEKPFEIPDSWEWVRFGEIGEIIGGGTPSSSNNEYYSENEIPWLTPADLKNYNNKYISGGNRYISELGLKKSSARMLPKNSILFSSRAPIGYVVINSVEICTNQGFKSIVPYKKNISEFIYYFLTYRTPYIESIATGTTFKEISGGEMKKLLMVLPPVAEQQRIVKKVEELFNLIDTLNTNKEAMLQNIKDTRSKVLELAIRGKLVEQNEKDEPAEVLLKKIAEEKEKLIKAKKIKKEKPLPEIKEGEKPFEIPKSWEWVRLGEICIINPRNAIEDNIEASFIEMSNFPQGYDKECKTEIRKWKEIKKGFTHFADGDIAIAKITPCFENKKSAILKNLKSGVGAGTTELYIFRAINERSIIGEYLYNIFVSDKFIEQGVKTYKGTAGQQRIKKDFVINYTIPLPPIAEQLRIVQKVEEIMAYLDELEKTILDKETI